MKTQMLARDKLKTQTNQTFTVLYDLVLYGILPIVFEMSYIRIVQKTMHAYAGNDVEGISRLILYFIIQWFLGILVKRDYVRLSLKKLTLGFLLFTQIQEFLISDVMVDLSLSILAESGIALAFFIHFADLLVLLKSTGVVCCIGFLLSFVSIFLILRIKTENRRSKSMGILNPEIIRNNHFSFTHWMWKHRYYCSC